MSYLDKHSKESGIAKENIDSIGNRINFARERITLHCLQTKAAKQVKNKLTYSHCTKILENEWEFGCKTIRPNT